MGQRHCNSPQDVIHGSLTDGTCEVLSTAFQVEGTSHAKDMRQEHEWQGGQFDWRKVRERKG